MYRNEEFDWKNKKSFKNRDFFHWEMLKKALDGIDMEQGYIIEGYPRNIEQIFFLEINQIKYDLVVDLYQPEDVILAKAKHRKICKKCFASYNDQEIMIGKYNLVKITPKVLDICDRCGSQLHIRDDDKIGKLKSRYFDYQVNQEPMQKYFKNKGKYLFLDLVNGIEDFSTLLQQLNSFYNLKP